MNLKSFFKTIISLVLFVFMTVSTAFAEEKSAVDASDFKNDLAIASKWVAGALNQTGYKADYSLDSLQEVDRFLIEQKGENGFLNGENSGYILFALGCYVGDTLIKENGGTWIVDASDPNPGINASVKLGSGVTIWPVQRVMKAYSDSEGNKLYNYGLKLSGK